MNKHLKSHLIHPEFLNNDDFQGFINDRARNILDLIQESIGKTVSGRDSEDVVREFGEPL